MPNIVEQQDLLKGLPDASIAKLMQSPSGQIPTFLVAAEAQRRQSIRQQFAPQANKESVVDQLTKHLTRVPENVKPGMGMTPPVPPTPQMAGVAALQQRQAIQQAVQPQAMASGGQVQRFAGGGVPAGWSVKALANMAAPEATVPGTVFYDRQGNPLPPDTPQSVQKYTRLGDPIETPMGLDFGTSNSALPKDFNAVTSQIDLAKQALGYGSKPRNTTTDLPPMAPNGGPPGGSETPMSDYRPSPEDNHSAYQHGKIAMHDKGPPSLEDQIKDAYAPQEVSSWEKAMPWFKAAAQFLDPSKTTAQSIGAAAEQFGGGEAEIARNSRQQGVDQKRAMLDYQMRVQQARVAAEQNKYERTHMTAGNVSDLIAARMKALDSAEAVLRDPTKQMGRDQAQIDAQLEQIQAERNQLAAAWQQQAYNSGIDLSGDTVDSLRARVSGNQ